MGQHHPNQWPAGEMAGLGVGATDITYLPDILFPRCYLPPSAPDSAATLESHLHVFCDASEHVYGAVAYLQSTDKHGHIHVSFIMARSRIAPKRQLSIPRLELCAALSGAQLANLLSSELSIPIQSVTLWTDSTTVLSWLTSDSCRFKVFVGTRVAEIQTLTETKGWKYVNSKSNPADNLTRGKTLLELTQHKRWSRGPAFLLLPTEDWPANPCLPVIAEPAEELRKVTFCGTAMLGEANSPDLSKHSSWEELMETTTLLYGAADTAQGFIDSKKHLLQRAQSDSFPEEFNSLKHGRLISTTSQLLPRLLNMILIFVSSEWEVGSREQRASTMTISIPSSCIQNIQSPNFLSNTLIRDYSIQALNVSWQK